MSSDYDLARLLGMSRLTHVVPNLTQAQWLDLFEVWHDHDRARQEAKESERRARLAKLWEELDSLFTERASLPPQQHAAVSERIAAIAREIADVMTPMSPPPLADWG